MITPITNANTMILPKLIVIISFLLSYFDDVFFRLLNPARTEITPKTRSPTGITTLTKSKTAHQLLTVPIIPKHNRQSPNMMCNMISLRPPFKLNIHLLILELRQKQLGLVDRDGKPYSTIDPVRGIDRNVDPDDLTL